MNHVKIFGIKMPIISHLDNGAYLVLHPNGPAIANGDTICTLDFNSEVEKPTARDKAIRAYVEWSWPATEQMRGTVQ